MSKKKGKNNNYKKIVFMSIILCVLIFVAVFIYLGKNPSEGQNAGGIEFPYEMEDGKLVIKSLFEANVENPDCNNEISENIAALEITNQSEEYCEQAEICLEMQDGKEFKFIVSDLPPEKTVWAFEINNSSIESDYFCKDITDKVVFGEKDYMEDIVSFSITDTTITIQNNTNEELTDILLKCHCLFDEVYFGGITYEYPVSTIPANGQIVVDAVDCFMGTAEVVGIIKDE